MSTMRLLLVGDVNCKLNGVLDEAPLEPLDGLFRSADLRVGNLEGAFHDAAVGLDYKPGWFHNEAEGVALIDGWFDAVACANNVHQGAAIGTSIAALDRRGIAHAGAGADRAAARTPAIIERGGRRVGLLAYTAIFWPTGHVATEASPGVAVVRTTTSYQPHPRLIEMPAAPAITRSAPNPEDVAEIQSDIAALREQVDLVVVYFHWGITGQDEIAEYQQALGRAAIEGGADIVAGSHPHIPQGIEFYQQGVILYSLGNFMFGWTLHQQMTKDGLIASVVVDDDADWSVEVRAVRRDDEGRIQPHGPDSADGRRIVERVAELSERFGTRIEPVGNTYRVTAADGSTFGRSSARLAAGG